ncbi:MAG: hypothetical protein V2A61_02435, partial [Calditrichota bacterium]
AGLTVHLTPRRFVERPHSGWAFIYSAAFAISIPAILEIVFRIPVNAYLPPDQISGKLTLIYLLSAIPFYLAGLVFSGLFATYPGRMGKLYAWDLFGAGAGAILIILLMNLVGGESAPFYISALGFGAAALLGGKRWKTGLTLTVAALVLGLSNPDVGWLRILYSKGQPITNLEARYNRWNSFSRIMVIPYKLGTDAAPQTWCPSPNYLDLLPHRNPTGSKDENFLSIMIDDGASTPVVPFPGRDLNRVRYLKYDLTSLSHRLRGSGTTLVIGSGGGRDVLTGLAFGAERVDAVDINPLIFEAMNGPICEYAGDLYHHPQVKAYTSEGRAFARNHPRTYDLVQIAMIDTWAATTAGAYSLTENNLYTVEAFQDYIHALKPGGIISFTRFIFTPPRQALRLASIFLEAARREGITHPERCILVAKYESLATLMFKTEPFTSEEIHNFYADLKDLGFHLVYAPDSQPDPYFRRLVNDPNRIDFYRQYPYDIAPPTDDRPFFFNMLKMKNFLRVFEEREGQRFNYYATYTLVVVVIISILATLVFLVAPTALGRAGLERFPGQVHLLLYFIAIGLSYLMVESALLQRFVLLLEHPAYAASGVIAGLLISSGLGSYGWGKTREDRRGKLLNLGFTVIAFGLLFHIMFGSALIHAAIQWPMGVKILISILLIAPLGLVMGIPLPAGITAAGRYGPGTVAWCWALNGAASVVVSSLAVAIAMTRGFRITLTVSLATYLLAYLFISLFIRRQAAAERQEGG